MSPQRAAFDRAQARADPRFPRDLPSFIDGWNAALAFQKDYRGNRDPGGNTRVLSALGFVAVAILSMFWYDFGYPVLVIIAIVLLYLSFIGWRRAVKLDLEQAKEFSKRWS